MRGSPITVVAVIITSRSECLLAKVLFSLPHCQRKKERKKESIVVAVFTLITIRFGKQTITKASPWKPSQTDRRRDTTRLDTEDSVEEILLLLSCTTMPSKMLSLLPLWLMLLMLTTCVHAFQWNPATPSQSLMLSSKRGRYRITPKCK